MGGIIQVKLLGATPKIKYKFKPKAKMPKAIKAPKTNSPKTLHRKDPANGVSQKKKVTQRFPKVLVEEALPLEFTPKYHIEAKLFGAEFSFWEKIPTLIRYVILKTDFIKKHKGNLSSEHSDILLKTAARLERLLGLVLNKSIPEHQLIMLEPIANLALMQPQTSVSISSRLNKLLADKSNNQTESQKLKQLLATLVRKPSIEHFSSCYRQVVSLTDKQTSSKQKQLMNLALQLQIQGLLKLRMEFQQRWLNALAENKTRQSINLEFKVDDAMPLFNYVPPTEHWFLRFEAIVSHITPVKLKVLFRFSAGSSIRTMKPLQARGEALLSGRHVKFFNDKHDATDYLSSGFLLNLCQPFSEAHAKAFKLIDSKYQNQTRAILLNNLKLQQQITHQASRSTTATAPDKKTKYQPNTYQQSSISQNLTYDFAKFVEAERVKAPLLNQLLQEPVRLACRNPQYFSLKVPHKKFGMVTRKGDLGFYWVKNFTHKNSLLIDHIESQTEVSEDDKAKLFKQRQKIKLAITALNAEYHAYLSIVKQFDDSSVTNYPQFREVKQQFENDRGAKCRAEYLRAVICTHALLVLAYHQSLSAKCAELNEPEINFCRYLSRLSQEYEHPDCHVPQDEINCYLTMTSVLKDTQIERWTQLDLDVELSDSVIHQGIIVKRVISDDLVPYVDGTYLDIALFTSASVHQGQHNHHWLEETLTQVFETAAAELERFSLSDLPVVDKSLITPNCHLNLQFKKNRAQCYELQFIRIYPTASLGQHTHEYATGSSLSYWLKKYNSWKDEHDTESWQRFCETNHSALQQLFTQIVAPNSYVANSLENVASQFEDQSSKRLLFKAILQWKKDAKLFPQALAAFEQFLVMQNQCYRMKILSRLSILKARLER